MPARRLSDQPSQLDPYDVLGQTDGSTDLMLHALLCNESTPRADVSKTTTVNCMHMGPPLGRRTDCGDAVGSAGLAEGHRRKIKTFVDDRRQERKAAKKRLQAAGRGDALRFEYCIHPAATKPSGEFPLWRFSCVGFVLEAYRAARIRLLGSPRPSVSVSKLKQLYPDSADELDDPSVCDRMGIGEGESWSVALVGYLLNSLARDTDEIHRTPYVPRVGDEYFPSQAQDTTLG